MTAAAPEHAFRVAGGQICEKQSAGFVPLRLSFALAKHLQAENKALISLLFTSGLHVRIPTGEPLDCFERTGTGERWSSTKSLQFQSDAGARIRNLRFALFTTKIYQQDSPQPSTCYGAVMPTPAICMHARAAMGAPKS